MFREMISHVGLILITIELIRAFTMQFVMYDIVLVGVGLGYIHFGNGK